MEQNDNVFVLLDNPGRLHFDVAKSRVFGNVCQPHKKFILKGEPVSLPTFLTCQLTSV